MILYQQRLKLAYLCVQMREQGIKIDAAYADDLKRNFEKHRALLFPSEKVGRRRIFRYFKPSAPPAQIIKWFKSAGIRLDSTSRSDVETAWLALSDESGWDDESLESEMPEPAIALRRLYWYKHFSRASLSLLHERWIDRNGVIHPRWHTIGNPIGSIECSKPGLPDASYMGGVVRRAVVPHVGYEALHELTIGGPPLPAIERLLLNGCGFAFLSERELDEALRKEDEATFIALYDFKLAGRTATLNSHRLALRLYGRRTKKARANAINRARPIVQSIVNRLEPIGQQATEGIAHHGDHYMRLHGNTLDDRFEAAAAFVYRVRESEAVNAAILQRPQIPVAVDGRRILYNAPKFHQPPLDLTGDLVTCKTMERWA